MGSRLFAYDGSDCIPNKVGQYKKDMVPIYKEKEEQIRAVFSEMPKAAEIEAMLQAVGLNMDTFYQLYGEDNIADAIAYAKELKDRYTVL